MICYCTLRTLIHIKHGELFCFISEMSLLIKCVPLSHNNCGTHQKPAAHEGAWVLTFIAVVGIFTDPLRWNIAGSKSDFTATGGISIVYLLCVRGDGERMRRLMGLVGEAGTGEVKMRRSGAGDLDRGLLGHRSVWQRKIINHVCGWLSEYCLRGWHKPCFGGRAGALGRGLEGAVCKILSPFSSLAET